MKKQWISYLCLVLLVPIAILVGVVFFEDRSYIFISFIIVIFASVAFFIYYESNEVNSRTLVILAILIALSVIGRFIFAAVPGFKPVTAIVVIAAIFFGSEMGFLVGALSALISNFYFGQGPWTPFQMFSWGMIGLIAGLPFIRTYLQNSKLLLSLFGIFAGIIYSLLMDIWTVMSFDGEFNLQRYIAAVSLSLPFMGMYALSNVIFLLLTIKPIGEKLKRLQIKYGLNGGK